MSIDHDGTKFRPVTTIDGVKEYRSMGNPAPVVMQEVHGSAWVNHQPVIMRALQSGSKFTAELATACGVDSPNATAFVRALRKLQEQGHIRKTGGGKDARGRQQPMMYELTAKDAQR